MRTDRKIPISVCVPVYNGRRHLDACLDSIKSQKFVDYEVIVVDDCSTDESYNIAVDYSRRDDRIRVYRNNKNLGLVHNWNRCIELSTGEWIKFVFQDDIIAPTCLEKMYNSRNLDKGFIVCRRDIVFENVDYEIQKGFDKYNTFMSIDSIFKGQHDISAKKFSIAVIENLSMNFVGEPTAVMIHNNVFRKYGKFNPNFIQLCDFEFWCRIGCNCGITYIPETLAIFRLHQNATSLKNRNERLYKTEMIDLMLLFNEFSKNPFYQELRYAALQNGPPHNFELLSALYLIREEAVGKFLSFLYRKNGYSPANELKAFKNKFPDAKVPKKLNWLRLLTPLILSKKIMRNIYRHFLMSMNCFTQVPK